MQRKYTPVHQFSTTCGRFCSDDGTLTAMQGSPKSSTSRLSVSSRERGRYSQSAGGICRSVFEWLDRAADNEGFCRLAGLVAPNLVLPSSRPPFQPTQGDCSPAMEGPHTSARRWREPSHSPTSISAWLPKASQIRALNEVQSWGPTDCRVEIQISSSRRDGHLTSALVHCRQNAPQESYLIEGEALCLLSTTLS